MTTRVVVLGAGYAGAAAVTRLEAILDGRDVGVTWVSRLPYHFVLHEAHRLVRRPDAADALTIPVGEIKSPGTAFVRATVTGIDLDAREIRTGDGEPIPYDYALIAIGSRTAFYGIPGVSERALTLEDRDDALAIHRAATDAYAAATPGDPARVVVGGAGLSGIQSAGEFAALRDDRAAPVEIHLVEALDEVLPGGDPRLQRSLRSLLGDAGISVLTGAPVVEVDDDRVHLDGHDPLRYDVFLWTGGITGRSALDDAALDADHRRVRAGSDFRTSDPRVLAVGDAALVSQDGDVAPPTAQAAWQAARVAAENLVRAIDGRPLARWRYEDRGTLVSVGDAAVAHDVPVVPLEVFDRAPARLLKKAVAARWIADVSTLRRAARAWPVL